VVWYIYILIKSLLSKYFTLAVGNEVYRVCSQPENGIDVECVIVNLPE